MTVHIAKIISTVDAYCTKKNEKCQLSKKCYANVWLNFSWKKAQKLNCKTRQQTISVQYI